jgi:hypothetical protein
LLTLERNQRSEPVCGDGEQPKQKHKRNDLLLPITPSARSEKPRHRTKDPYGSHTIRPTFSRAISNIEPTEVSHMNKLTLVKLEKRIAPRYMPFAS